MVQKTPERFDDLSPMQQRLVLSIGELAQVLGKRTFEVSERVLRLGAAILEIHYDDFVGSVGALDAGLIRVSRTKAGHYRIRVRPTVHLGDSDAETREHVWASRVRRIVLFFMYDQERSRFRDVAVPLATELADELQMTKQEVCDCVDHLCDLGYLDRPLCDVFDGVSVLSSSGRLLCEDRRRLFSEFCPLSVNELEESTEVSTPDGKAELPTPVGTYCEIVSHEGKKRLDRNQYSALLERRADYDMFIDGVAMVAFREPTSDSGIRLTYREFRLLMEFIERGCWMNPVLTDAGKRHCSSEGAAYRLFEEARRKVDVRLTRYEFRAFATQRGSQSSQKTYRFAPPDGFRFCVVIPTGFSDQQA